MKNKPDINPGDWIYVGDKGQVNAVVANILDGTSGDCEVVYLDQKECAINEEVKWNGKCWEFLHSGPCGGYADNYDRLREFVAILRRGRFNSRFA